MILEIILIEMNMTISNWSEPISIIEILDKWKISQNRYSIFALILNSRIVHTCNYSCVFGKRNYRVLVRVCVCVCLCVCVFLHDNSKRNWSRNTKLEYIVVYENSSDEFDIELPLIKVKVTVGVQKLSPFTTIQTVRSYSSTLVRARNLISSMYLHLILIYKIYESRHAWMILRIPREHWKLTVWTLYPEMPTTTKKS